ncbi:MAG TPA: metal-dependent transcriptional regulator [bacterium]|nr:metal-dependent transcriptional regulator [bacterium]
MLTQSLEDYLEAIKILKKEKGIARVKDIGRFLKVKDPSVVSALGILSQNGYVEHEKYGYVELTPKGKKEASRIHKKHRTIVKFLNQKLKIPIEIAREDACRIEHVISNETYEKILAASEEKD